MFLEVKVNDSLNVEVIFLNYDIKEMSRKVKIYYRKKKNYCQNNICFM